MTANVGFRVDTLQQLVDVEGDCWMWSRCLNTFGYGVVRWQGRPQLAHRAAYSLLVGDIPVGLTLDHLCRRPACINPDHLQPVSQRENVRRGFSQNGLNARKSHCHRGHPFNEHNTYIHPTRGSRHCKACQRINHRKTTQ